jgi:GT2 family glycosyltransferase
MKLSIFKFLKPLEIEFIKIKEASSMAQGYNRGLEKATGELLIFCHEDLEFTKPIGELLVEKLSEDNSGFVGPAGAYYYRIPAWWDRQNGLSGEVWHTHGYKMWKTSYGEFRQVVALDGLFLATRRDSINRIGGFDENLNAFDFYDIEATVSMHQKGLINQTLDLGIIHKSLGTGFQEENWRKGWEYFQHKHGEHFPLWVKN